MNVYIKKSLGSTQSKSRYAWQKIAIFLVVIITLIVLLNFFQQPIKNTVYVVASPFLKFFWGAGKSVNSFIAPIAGFQKLTRENNAIKQENQYLLSKIHSLEEAIRQDQILKEAALNTAGDNFNMVLVQIIGLDTANDVILLGKGSNDGIQENMPVISEQKVLYGKILKVYKTFSQAMLISNKNSVVDAKIQDVDIARPSILGAIKGGGNLSVYLDLVASDAEIKEGDNIFTSGLEGTFPKGILIGRVTLPDKSDLKPFQTASVAPFFDIKNIENLFIITDYKTE